MVSFRLKEHVNQRRVSDVGGSYLGGNDGGRVLPSADSDEAAPLFRDDCAPGFRDDLAP
ncbi:hypothetical protein GOC60_29000, partial [Sinorhizobium meliloti]|nr:hypothetical protein [Sinorhizobium meliloti]MDX0265136.1 hypothetical protein [Sinorhizobium meliloti]